MFEKTGDEQRWAGLAPALAILNHVNPEVALWVHRTHDQGRLVFTDRYKDAGDELNFLAKFDVFRRDLVVSRGLFAESDGAVAAILCHEYRHSRQRFPKTLSYALSFLFLHRGDSSIVENDALLYEQEAYIAIFGKPE